MTDLTKFLAGISTVERLGLVRWVAPEGVVSMAELAREWPAVPASTLGPAAGVLVGSGWFVADGRTSRRATVVQVLPSAPRRLMTLLDELDVLSHPASAVDVEQALSELTVLRKEATRNVLARLAARDHHVEHPRELGLPLGQAWEGWAALHRAGWMADGMLVRARSSSVRTLSAELIRAVEV